MIHGNICADICNIYIMVQSVPSLKLLVAFWSSNVVKFFQEGLKKQKSLPELSLEPSPEFSLLLFHLSLAAPSGGKLDNLLIDFCFHSWKQPRHRDALLISEDEMLALEELVSESEHLEFSSMAHLGEAPSIASIVPLSTSATDLKSA